MVPTPDLDNTPEGKHSWDPTATVLDREAGYFCLATGGLRLLWITASAPEFVLGEVFAEMPRTRGVWLNRCVTVQRNLSITNVRNINENAI